MPDGYRFIVSGCVTMGGRRAVAGSFRASIISLKVRRRYSERQRGIQQKQFRLSSFGLCEYRCSISCLCADSKLILFCLCPAFFSGIRRQVVFCNQRTAYLSELYQILFCRLLSRKKGAAHLPGLFYNCCSSGNRTMPIELFAYGAIFRGRLLEIPRSESSISQLSCALTAGNVRFE